MARFAPATRLIAAVGLLLVATTTTGTQAPSQPPPRDPAREVATSVADGFTLAAVGDCIIARPISRNRDAGFTGVASLLRDADATFGNFEGSAFDIRQFKGYPQAEFGGVWRSSACPRSRKTSDRSGSI